MTRTDAPAAPSRANARLIRFAYLAAGVVLFVAPFRSSAGLRGGLLLLAGAALAIAFARAGQWRQLLPRERLLGAAILAWVAAGTAWSFGSPDLLDSLGAVRRDILTPTLAFLVFHALTRCREDLFRWMTVLVCGTAILAWLIANDPADPRAFGPSRPYVDVGWLTAWLVTVAPVFGLLLVLPARRRTAGALLFVVAVASLVTAAWLSGNRVVWACFAAVVVAHLAFALRRGQPRRVPHSVLALSAALLSAVGILMAASLQSRAESQAGANASSIEFLMQDHRTAVWREAWRFFRERPWQGYGYGDATFADTFASRFDPGLRHLLRHAHNTVLNHGLQMGVAGAIIILVVFAALLRTFARRLGHGALARAAAIAGISLVAAVFLRNVTDDFFSRHAVLGFGAIAGMLSGLGSRRPPLSAIRNARC